MRQGASTERTKGMLMMVKRAPRVAMSVLMVSLFLSHPLHGEVPAVFQRVFVEFTSGYSQVAGTYADEINGAPFVGVSIFPAGYRFIFAELCFSYASYALAASADSALQSTTFGAGPLFLYAPFRYLELYAGVAFVFSYYSLRAVTTNREEQTLNPGFALKAGAHVPIDWGLGVKAGIEYTHNYLSNKPFMNINYHAGVTYDLGYLYAPKKEPDTVSEKEKLKERIDSLFRKGKESLDNGEVDAAKDNFSQVLSLKPDHKEAKDLQDMIGQKEESFQSARDLLEQKQFYKAIPVLEDAGSVLPEAKTLLSDVRNQLSVEVPALEKEGIKAYEAKEYEKCIGIMQRIKLINPANGVVQIYLPRALRRLEALQKLK